MISFDFDYTGWERLQEKILRVPPKLGKNVSDKATQEAKTYLSSVSLLAVIAVKRL